MGWKKKRHRVFGVFALDSKIQHRPHRTMKRSTNRSVVSTRKRKSRGCGVFFFFFFIVFFFLPLKTWYNLCASPSSKRRYRCLWTTSLLYLTHESKERPNIEAQTCFRSSIFTHLYLIKFKVPINPQLKTSDIPVAACRTVWNYGKNPMDILAFL